MNLLSETDKAYLAGIIDGEGTLGIYQTGRGLFIAAGAIYNNSTLLLEWLKSRLGLSACMNRNDHPKSVPGGHPYYTMNIRGKNLQEVLRAVRSYLVIKAEIADIILSFPLSEGHRKLTDEVRLEQAICCARFNKAKGKYEMKKIE